MTTTISARSVRLLLAVALLLAACPLARAEAAPGPAIRVALAPVVVDRMSGIAWRAMTDECNAIWAPEGIALTWSGEDAGADVVLPLIFDHRQLKKHDPKTGDAFGVTLFAGRSQRILVSIDRARDVVGLRRGLADSNNATTLDIAMGTLLGRVVAHEIGHALLLTLAHATEGLMRARLDADDLRPALDGQFALVAPDRQRLAVRFSHSAAREPVPATFTWTDAPPAPSPRRAQR
jgi:hypothetical protein